MKRILVSLCVAGIAAVALSGCVYDPYRDGPYGYGALTPRQAARMNDPAWCNYHPQRCAALRARAGYGPPPPPPPGYNGPPPQGADGPPQNMPPPNQPPPQQQQ